MKVNEQWEVVFEVRGDDCCCGGDVLCDEVWEKVMDL